MNSLHKLFSTRIFVLLCALSIMVACTYDPNLWKTDPQYNRIFRPSDFAASGVAITTAKLSWKAIPGAKEYVVEISTSGDFTADLISYTTTTNSYELKDLFGEMDYHARVKVVPADATQNYSNYSVLTFRTKGQQIVLPTQDGDIQSNAIVVRWKTNEGSINRLVVTNLSLPESAPIEIPITEEQFIVGEYKVAELQPNTEYHFGLCFNQAVRGFKQAYTKSDVPPADQTIRFDPAVHQFNQDLFNTFLPGKVTLILPSATTIVFVAPESDSSKTSIDIPDGVQLTIVGDPSGRRSVLRNPTFNFRGSSNGNTALLIQNLEITPAAGNYYLVNQSIGAQIEHITLDDCYVHDFTNCLFRMQGSNKPVVKWLKIYNTVLEAMGASYDFIVTSAGGSSVLNIEMLNSTYYNTKPRSFIAMHADSPDMESIVISNCTFYNFLGATRYLIDLSASNKAELIKIENCILGATSDAAARGIRQASGASYSIINTYTTTDFVLGSNLLLGELVPYAGASKTLFNDPDNGVFTFKDDAFVGRFTVGDPRWFSEQ